VLAADGLIVSAPVFNGSCSGLFKLFFDVIEQGSLQAGRG
jgi:FMN reductase